MCEKHQWILRIREIYDELLKNSTKDIDIAIFKEDENKIKPLIDTCD